MDISVDLYYNDENIGGKIDVLRIRKSLRDRSNPLELPNAKFYFVLVLYKNLVHLPAVAIIPSSVPISGCAWQNET
ncbi:PREDICTED: uncharacterized protein LOC108975761 isoform X3 [Bactrocera latifrons]|uniref:uncharacterized protein LOC108975761 isoform X3 n=1 Tax=Bactrocera latifrons TaxID=174628 RepID=UPI0008DD4F16|nr:PREDICTED: uncharacterized protein LOC108975761 isoform X3 [Bactrocera latifrons]